MSGGNERGRFGIFPVIIFFSIFSLTIVALGGREAGEPHGGAGLSSGRPAGTLLFQKYDELADVARMLAKQSRGGGLTAEAATSASQTIRQTRERVRDCAVHEDRRANSFGLLIDDFVDQLVAAIEARLSGAFVDGASLRLLLSKIEEFLPTFAVSDGSLVPAAKLLVEAALSGSSAGPGERAPRVSAPSGKSIAELEQLAQEGTPICNSSVRETRRPPRAPGVGAGMGGLGSLLSRLGGFPNSELNSKEKGKDKDKDKDKLSLGLPFDLNKKKPDSPSDKKGSGIPAIGDSGSGKEKGGEPPKGDGNKDKPKEEKKGEGKKDDQKPPTSPQDKDKDKKKSDQARQQGMQPMMSPGSSSTPSPAQTPQASDSDKKGFSDILGLSRSSNSATTSSSSSSSSSPMLNMLSMGMYGGGMYSPFGAWNPTMATPYTTAPLTAPATRAAPARR